MEGKKGGEKLRWLRRGEWSNVVWKKEEGGEKTTMSVT